MSLVHPLWFPQHSANHRCYNMQIRTLPKSNLQRMGFIFHKDQTVRWNQSDIFGFSFVPEFVFLCSESRPPRLAHMAASAVGFSQAWLRMPAATPAVTLHLLSLPGGTPVPGCHWNHHLPILSWHGPYIKEASRDPPTCLQIPRSVSHPGPQVHKIGSRRWP